MVNHLAAIDGRPRACNHKPPAGVPKQSFSDHARRVAIHDLRGRKAEFTLDRHGFAAVRHRSREIALDEDAMRGLHIRRARRCSPSCRARTGC